MPHFWVNTQWDLVLASPWMHDVCLPPAIPAPVPMPAVDLPCTQHWAVLSSAKFTTTVKHVQQFIVLDGHNVGYLVLHVTIPASPLIAVHILLSTREVKFSASKIKMNGTAAGCAFPGLLPMMDCGDPAGNPLAMAVSAPFTSTLTVNMEFIDVLAGLAAVAGSLLIDGFFGRGGIKGARRGAKALVKGGRSAAKRAAQRMSKAAVEGGKAASKTIIGAVARKAIPKLLGLPGSTSKGDVAEFLMKVVGNTIADSAIETAKTGNPTLVAKSGGNLNKMEHKVVHKHDGSTETTSTVSSDTSMVGGSKSEIKMEEVEHSDTNKKDTTKITTTETGRDGKQTKTVVTPVPITGQQPPPLLN